MEDKKVQEPIPPSPPRGVEITGKVKTNFGRNTVLEMRDLREKKHMEEQLKLYALCSCRSGKKYKFCCKGKQMIIYNTEG